MVMKKDITCLLNRMTTWENYALYETVRGARLVAKNSLLIFQLNTLRFGVIIRKDGVVFVLNPMPTF